MPTDRIEGLTTARFASILSVALNEFASSRYNDASFNRIIKNCQMAKGTMYYYFKSKEDLFLTIHKATLRDFKKVSALAASEVLNEAEYWQLAEEILLEFYRTLYRRPTASQFVTNFLTQESRREGHPAIETVNRIDEWLKDFLYRGQELGAIRQDLSLEHVATLAWGIWESCRSWFPSETKRMQDLVHPDIVLDLYRRTLSPKAEVSQPMNVSTFSDTDNNDDSAFAGAQLEELDHTSQAGDEPANETEGKVPQLFASFKES